MINEKNTVKLQDSYSQSPLYSQGLAPVPKDKRTWGIGHLAAIWVGMAVCIPTYLLASYMIKSGLNWIEVLVIIGIANIVITVPMVLNGHAGVKYGIPFPVIGRAAFGTRGVHLASITRGVIACGWFGVQTWIGGLAIYSIYNVISGTDGELGLTVGKFVGFGIFWGINMYFIWKGTESIKWLEAYSAPILIAMGFVLIGWGYANADSFSSVLEKSNQLGRATATIKSEKGSYYLYLNALTGKDGTSKVDEYGILTTNGKVEWMPYTESPIPVLKSEVLLQFRNLQEKKLMLSSIVTASLYEGQSSSLQQKIWDYLIWFTAMVGFWATMAISISDITRYAQSQRHQVLGQFIGLPGTMMLYSFVGIFVTCAAVLNFKDVLVSEDAPWDPVSLLSKFDSPYVVVIAQLFMLIATLSTNIAANVIAPSNAFSNLNPKKISFRTGGIITGCIGIVIAPWWLLDEISNILVFISGLLGPVLGILITDYFIVRKKELKIEELFKPNGIYAYGSTGYNRPAMLSLLTGIFSALVGFWIPSLSFLYSLSWFVGFSIASFTYYFLMKNRIYVHTY